MVNTRVATFSAALRAWHQRSLSLLLSDQPKNQSGVSTRKQAQWLARNGSRTASDRREWSSWRSRHTALAQQNHRAPAGLRPTIADGTTGVARWKRVFTRNASKHQINNSKRRGFLRATFCFEARKFWENSGTLWIVLLTKWSSKFSVVLCFYCGIV